MACCALVAIIISQLIGVWRARRRIGLYAAGLLVSMGFFTWQINQHWYHLRQVAWDMQVMVQGEDPAVAALLQPGVICKSRAASTRSTSIL